MKNLAATYQHIADILSYDSDTSTLESTLSQPAFNWDVIVKEGSKHLVLPAIFCRLQSKQLAPMQEGRKRESKHVKERKTSRCLGFDDISKFQMNAGTMI